MPCGRGYAFNPKTDTGVNVLATSQAFSIRLVREAVSFTDGFRELTRLARLGGEFHDSRKHKRTPFMLLEARRRSWRASRKSTLGFRTVVVNAQK
jgi:hypothetical protein